MTGAFFGAALLCLACYEGLDPSMCLVPDSIMVELLEESPMRDVIKYFEEGPSALMYLLSQQARVLLSSSESHSFV